jgi:hypothetical protein
LREIEAEAAKTSEPVGHQKRTVFPSSLNGGP